MDYRISGERLTGIADQVRRVSGSTEPLTPEQMETNLLNVTPMGEYPQAEKAGFGYCTAGEETGIIELGGESQNNMRKAYTVGWRFTASEAFSIIGLRHKQNHNYFKYLKLYDVDGKVVFNKNVTSDYTSEWVSYYFDDPISVAAGDTYTVAMFTQNYVYGSVAETIMNAKLCDVTPVMSNYDKQEFPVNSATMIFALDIIMTPVQAPLPDEYVVKRSTMDEIAKEIQRITDDTSIKLSTSRIISILQGVEVQEQDSSV